MTGKQEVQGPVVIFGGGGFVGRQVAQELLQRGYRVRIAQRDPRSAFQVKALGGLGQVQFVAADVARPESVAAAVVGASAVVNLVGLLKGPMQVAHVDGARNVAEATALAGMPVLVHMSAIGADAGSDAIYARTKGEGEAAVRRAFPSATIVRPSIIFGRDDQFTNRFAGLIAALPIVPVIRGAVKFQPVHVGDVARAIANLVEDAGAHAGTTYEFGGPDILTLSQINSWLAQETGRSPMFVPVPDAAACALATLTGWAPGAPITADQFRMLQTDNVVAPGSKGLSDLDIEPTPLASVAPAWLSRFRKHGRFSSRVSA
ncbi:complex I NDUFA9 subunit family protein [Sphingobium sp. CR28]|uniref:complex I NDUFA9 subunit family protein n=1 Tax=Sphingobium sp. CR28 TaxID=3400272 RepID=UPI003FEE819D